LQKFFFENPEIVKPLFLPTLYYWEVSILSGIIRVDNKEDSLQFTVVRPPSPGISSFISSSEPDVSVEVDQNPFLPSPLLRASVHEDAVVDNAVSTTPSPPAAHKRIKKERKNLNINYFFVCFFVVYNWLFIVLINKNFLTLF
jgi:hypothetical protein